MLTELHIQNWVTIQELNLEFQMGTTVITGETGTGKSIIIDAIELALGGRATSDWIRPGQDKTDISIRFDITQLPMAKQWLKNYDLEQANECIIRRTIHRDGRSRSFINGSPTTLQPLRELSELLLQIHGQHEQQFLLKGDLQRALLDRHAKHDQLAAEVKRLSDEWHTLNREMDLLHQRIEQHKTQGEFLKYQLNELESLNLTQNEFIELDKEHQQLAHMEELLQQLQSALNCLAEQEGANALHYLHQTLQSLEMVAHIDTNISTWVLALKNTLIQMTDIEDELRRYLEHAEAGPERLQWLEQRISTWFNIARKHKVAPHELFAVYQKMSREYNDLETSDARLAELSVRCNQIEGQYFQTAKKLSLGRQQAAVLLGLQITEIIHSLSMAQADFFVHLEEEPQKQITPFGLEKIMFQLKPHAEQTWQPLARVASGGELSRIGLALYLATAGQSAVPTLIFDEVDLGMGGGTAEKMGKLLRDLGKTQQVLCITHQPQVAALGHHHLCVKKTITANATLTGIHYLSKDEKIAELARMLGGIAITPKTWGLAQEMIETNTQL